MVVTQGPQDNRRHERLCGYGTAFDLIGRDSVGPLPIGLLFLGDDIHHGLGRFQVVRIQCAFVQTDQGDESPTGVSGRQVLVGSLHHSRPPLVGPLKGQVGEEIPYGLSRLETPSITGEVVVVNESLIPRVVRRGVTPVSLGVLQTSAQPPAVVGRPDQIDVHPVSGGGLRQIEETKITRAGELLEVDVAEIILVVAPAVVIPCGGPVTEVAPAVLFEAGPVLHQPLVAFSYELFIDGHMRFVQGKLVFFDQKERASETAGCRVP